MKRCVSLLLIGCAVAANAQSQDLPKVDTILQVEDRNVICQDSLNTLYSVPAIDDKGVLIIPDNCDEKMLASLLNTSSDIAKKILNVWNNADSMSFANIRTSEKELSRIARIIYRHLDNDLSKGLFVNYWTGGGDIELSDKQFADILVCIATTEDVGEWFSDDLKDDGRNQPRQLSFYNTKYEEAFGVATVYIDTENRIVGFSDTYDFDSKKWGIRPLKYELFVRLVSLISPSKASKFNIKY